MIPYITTPVWLSFLLLISLLLIVKITALSLRRSKNLPPGPPGLPIIGNLHQLGEVPHRSLQAMSKKYGPILHLNLGFVSTVVVSSPDAAREVLKTHDVHCCSRPLLAGTQRLSYNYLDIAFAPFTGYWKEARKICVLELFSAKRVQSFGSAREEEIALMINSISKSASSGTPVNLSKELLSLTARIICRVAFGMHFQGSMIDNERFEQVVNQALEDLGSLPASDFFPYVGWIVDRVTGLHDRCERTFRSLDAFFEEAIDLHFRKRESGDGQEDIIDVLLKLQREQVELGVARLTRNHIKAILTDIFLGGVDTSAVTLTWAMTELARNPQTMKKLQDKIRKSVGAKEKISQEDIDKLDYLKMVIKETWRLHSPVPLLIPRQAISEFKIGNYTIRPETRIHVNVWAIGRDPNVWKDPENFIPERFTDNEIDAKGQNFELLPFGGGRRICPGMQMATAVVELALANLLHRFDWKLPVGMVENNIGIEEAAGLTCYKKVPLELVPVKYQN